MKTNRQIQSWLRHAAVLLLALTGSLSAEAQDIGGGEAFYIYQNDGHFDGFFYDEVKQISYSRLDTLGVEHDKYVSQEIVTEDSVYRFMLTAIDSVSFVQPEIKYAKGVRLMRDEGMMDYYMNTAKGDEGVIYITFHVDMPTDMIPKVGDVMVCPNLEGWEEGTLVAKVDKVDVMRTLIMLTCSYIDDIHDVFEQFITVEQVTGVQTPEGSSLARRMAGMPAQTRAEGNVSDLTLFNFNYTFEGKTTLYDKLKLQLVLNTGFGMTLNAAYKITLSEFYIKTQMKSQMSVGGSFGLDGELYANADLKTLPGIGEFVEKFTKIPFPANFPILFVDMVPLPFTRAEAHLNLSVAVTGQVKATNFMFEIKDTWPYVDMGLNFIAPFLPYQAEPVEKGLSINAQINGTMQSGLKFPIILSTLPWIKKACFVETGMTIYAGPKVSGVLNFDLLQSGKSVYEGLKDSKVDLSLISVDTEIEGEATVLGKKWETKRTKSWTYGNLAFTLFPSFGDVSFELLGNNQDEIHCRCDVEGLTCLPEVLGIGVYSKADENDTKFSNLYDSFFMPGEYWFRDNYNTIEGGFTKMEAGEYRLRPIITFPGVESLQSLTIPVYEKEVAVVIEAKDMKLDPEEITAEEEGGEFTVKLVTGLDMPINSYPNDDWITTEIMEPSGNEKYRMLKVKVAENNTDAYRTGTVTVRQRYTETEYVDKTLTVKQYGGLQLSPSTLTIEKEGGTKTVNILTSMDPITIDLNDGKNWLDYDLDKRTLTIKASENTGAQRTATVIVSAWSSKHNGINAAHLTIVQEGAVNASVQPSELTFQANGGTQQVSVTLGDGVSLTNAFVGEDASDWIIVEKGSSYVNITAMPNTTAQQRDGVVYCEVTKDDTGEKAQLPVSVTQEFGTASVNPASLLFGADGGEQQTKIDMGTFTYCGVIVGNDGAGWVTATAETDGTVTIIVDPNPKSMQRECTVNCWVSGIKNPSDDDMMILPVKVIQDPGSAIEPVTPDGDASPFKHINFWTTRRINMVTDGSEASNGETDINVAFNFKPDNSTFKVEYGKTINHYECRGYIEKDNSKQAATLTFDIDKTDDKVKNLYFTYNTESLMEISLVGYTSHTTSWNKSSLTLGDFPLETNGNSYKEGKVSVAQGLTFPTFSSVLDEHTYYTSTLYPDDVPDPVNTHSTYVPTDNTDDYVWLIISYKDGKGEPVDLDWPNTAVMTSLKNDGMPVYEGENPPDVNGTYILSPLKIVADPTGEGSAELIGAGVDGVVLQFSGQSDGQIIVNKYFLAGNYADVADDAMKGLITGNGKQFSICAPDGYGGAIIISGEMDGSTIYNLHYATCDMNKAGQHIILSDNDGTSSTTSWSPGTN
jgi:hypothetical protein